MTHIGHQYDIINGFKALFIDSKTLNTSCLDLDIDSDDFNSLILKYLNEIVAYYEKRIEDIHKYDLATNMTNYWPSYGHKYDLEFINKLHKIVRLQTFEYDNKSCRISMYLNSNYTDSQSWAFIIYILKNGQPELVYCIVKILSALGTDDIASYMKCVHIKIKRFLMPYVKIILIPLHHI